MIFIRFTKEGTYDPMARLAVGQMEGRETKRKRGRARRDFMLMVFGLILILVDGCEVEHSMDLLGQVSCIRPNDESHHLITWKITFHRWMFLTYVSYKYFPLLRERCKEN